MTLLAIALGLAACVAAFCVHRLAETSQKLRQVERRLAELQQKHENVKKQLASRAPDAGRAAFLARLRAPGEK